MHSELAELEQLGETLTRWADGEVGRTRFGTGALFACEDKILLGLRYADNHPGANRWSVPGGHLRPHETPLQGALRAAREETGWDLHADDPALPHALSAHYHQDIGVFYVTLYYVFLLASCMEPADGMQAWNWTQHGSIKQLQLFGGLDAVLAQLDVSCGIEVDAGAHKATEATVATAVTTATAATVATVAPIPRPEGADLSWIVAPGQNCPECGHFTTTLPCKCGNAW